MSPIERIAEMVDMLRAHGVTHFEGPIHFDEHLQSHLCVDLAPIIGPVAVTGDDTQTDTTPLCRCGHPLHEHQNGLCLQACDADKCGEG